MRTNIFKWAAVAMLAFATTACSNEESIIIDDPDTEYSDGSNSQPTEDEVKTLFNGKTFILAENGTLINFLKKRMSNIVTSIDEDDISVIFITEDAAGEIMAENKLYERISNLWWSNSTIAFIHPKANSLQLLSRLRRPTYEYTAPVEINNKIVESFNDVALWLIKANGNNLTVSSPDREQIAKTTNTSLNENGEAIETKNGALDLTATPSNFI